MGDIPKLDSPERRVQDQSNVCKEVMDALMEAVANSTQATDEITAIATALKNGTIQDDDAGTIDEKLQKLSLFTRLDINRLKAYHQKVINHMQEVPEGGRRRRRRRGHPTMKGRRKMRKTRRRY
jgi:hypothetical protein